MGRECCTYGVKERCIESCSGKNFRESGHLEDPGVDGRTILR